MDSTQVGIKTRIFLLLKYLDGFYFTKINRYRIIGLGPHPIEIYIKCHIIHIETSTTPHGRIRV